MSQERPYINCYSDALEEELNQNWDDWHTLLQLLHELQYRKRNKARQLFQTTMERLIEIHDGSFDLPKTDVIPGYNEMQEIDATNEGMLRFMGYRVGNSGIIKSNRRIILDYVYNDELPLVSNAEYVAQWGQPKTGIRLSKLINCLASFARNAKRNNADYSKAITDWENDLEYLRKKYYVGRYDFIWPTF